MINATAMFHFKTTDLFGELGLVNIYMDGIVIDWMTMIEHIVHVIVTCSLSKSAELNFQQTERITNVRFFESKTKLRSFLMFCSFDEKFEKAVPSNSFPAEFNENQFSEVQIDCRGKQIV